MEVLQTSALPLGDGAGRNWGSKLTWNVRPRLSTQPTATSGRIFVDHRSAHDRRTHIIQSVARPQTATSNQSPAERSRRRSGGVVKRAGAAQAATPNQ